MKNILSNSNGSKERYQIYMENEVKNSNQIVLTAQGEETIFYVLEQTKLGGSQYILVTDTQEGDGEALILKEVSAQGLRESVYETVEDDTELEAVAAVFENLLEDIELT